MLPLAVGPHGGTALWRAGGAAALLALLAGGPSTPRWNLQAPPPAGWANRCAERMSHSRGELRHYARALRRAEVRVSEAGDTARVELALPPQYSALIEYRTHGDAPSVFDWEEAPTPVMGSFALHRHVGHFDLVVVADDSDQRGLRFAAAMQPLLDQCLMDAE